MRSRSGRDLLSSAISALDLNAATSAIANPDDVRDRWLAAGDQSVRQMVRAIEVVFAERDNPRLEVRIDRPHSGAKPEHHVGFIDGDDLPK